MPLRRLHAAALVSALSTSPLPAQQPNPLPGPTGRFAVGTRRVEWADSSRPEIGALLRRDSSGVPRTAPPSGPRRVAVQLWYPTAAPASAARAPYNPSAVPFAGVLRDTARLRYYRALSGRAALDAAPLAGARHPLLLFSPGGSMFVEDYTSSLEELASHGYVVVAVAHPGTSLVAFADGSFGTETAWRPPPTLSRSLEPDSLRASWAFYRTRDAYLASDLRFAAGRVADPAWSPLAPIVDTTRVGLIGHSTGGSVVTTASAGWSGASRRAVVVYDVILPGVMFEHRITTPFLQFRTTATNYPPGWTDRLLDVLAHVRAEGLDVLVDGGTHSGFSDRVLLAAADSGARTAARRQLEAVRAYTRAFLDRHLKGEPPRELDDSAAAARLGVRVTRHPR